MPKSDNQKMKLLLISDFLKSKTDETHSVTSVDILNMLKANGISAERKSVYSDVNALQRYGMDISVTTGRTGGIKLLSKDFELAELKLLVDAIQSSRFITEKKSLALINKLSSFASEYEAHELQRLVFISNRIKNENESIYYSTDNIYNAINSDKQISFLYFNYGADKKRHYHNNRMPIQVSPFALQYDSEKYYLVAYESASGKIKHYRVDKMMNVEIKDEIRDGKSHFEDFDIAEYSNATVTMFSGKITKLTLKCPDSLAGAVMDKFGTRVKFIPTQDGEFTVTVNAALSPTLYSWIFTFGGSIKIIEPAAAVKDYRLQLEKALNSTKI